MNEAHYSNNTVLVSYFVSKKQLALSSWAVIVAAWLLRLPRARVPCIFVICHIMTSHLTRIRPLKKTLKRFFSLKGFCRASSHTHEHAQGEKKRFFVHIVNGVFLRVLRGMRKYSVAATDDAAAGVPLLLHSKHTSASL